MTYIYRKDSNGSKNNEFLWDASGVYYQTNLSWWRHQMETFSALLAICAGNSPASAEFPAQRPVTRSFDVFFDLCLNKRLRKQSRGWWFETLSIPLWRHCHGCSSIPLFTQKWKQGLPLRYYFHVQQVSSQLPFGNIWHLWMLLGETNELCSIIKTHTTHHHSSRKQVPFQAPVYTFNTHHICVCARASIQ